MPKAKCGVNYQSDDFDDDLDPLIFEKAPVSKDDFDPPKNSTPTHHQYDPNALATYIYPTNLQVRDYQYNIVHRALYHNTLVALPTGLGKTFIASTVILNFLRWFPTLKIVFMAPTKPLVAQQIKACCGITGIPSSEVAILLDKTRRNRAAIWDEKLVFFTTPQVVENDLTTGIVNPKQIVLLVIDEAHRAKGNYAYNNVVKFLNRFNRSFRILALTATPASDVDGVQEIINNLHISKVEVRTERSIDIYKYLKRKTIDRVTVSQSDEIRDAIDLICEAIEPVLETANQRKVYEVTDPSRINAFTALDAQQRLVRNPNIPEGLKWANYFILQLLVVVGQCMRRLNIYGIRSFYSYFKEKHKEFAAKYNNKKSTNHMAAKFYFHPNITKLLATCEGLMQDPKFLGHQKLEVVISELTSFFENRTNADSRVIIFTEFRESALDIVRAIETLGSELKPHIFIGQAKEKEKFDEEKFLKKGKKPKKGSKTPAKEKTPPSLAGNNPTSSELAQMTGLNQKMQKELIKKFKSGVYNILVATSIGEEGLDIGEVDLIVCYDSTASPIKNVQRMGRTGRNRDGKVLLLFSSNEELKFDKAMGGYEYIQQHIMSGNLIELCGQNRILPAEFTPTVEEKLIEIPEENEDIRQEDDEDEIIKIATKYMTGSQKKGKAKRGVKPAKIEKRFFMPDDVETGFQLVSDMLKESTTKRRRSSEEDLVDVLPKVPDSDEEQLIITEERQLVRGKNEHSKMKLTSNQNTEARKRKIARTTAPKSEVPTIDLRVKQDSALKVANSSGSSERTFRQPLILNWQSCTVELPNPNRQSSAGNDQEDEDDFDDDDESVLALARQASFNDQHLISQPELGDEIFDLKEFEGFLTPEQSTELYMNYYTSVDAYGLINCYNPLRESQACDYPHSSRLQKFLRFQRFVKELSEEDSVRIVEEYKREKKSLTLPLGDFVDFD